MQITPNENIKKYKKILPKIFLFERNFMKQKQQKEGIFCQNQECKLERAFTQ